MLINYKVAVAVAARAKGTKMVAVDITIMKGKNAVGITIMRARNAVGITTTRVRNAVGTTMREDANARIRTKTFSK